MPRYLTSVRICFLVLIQIFLDGEKISAESSLSLLEFIASQIIPGGDQDETHIRERLHVTTTDARAFASKLQKHPSSHPGRNVYDVLLYSLWEMKGLDSLHDLLQDLRETLSGNAEGEIRQPRLTPASPFGQFIRRCFVEHTRLRFADSQSLWNAFVIYRAATFDDWSAKNPELAARISVVDPARDILAEPGHRATNENGNMSTIDGDMLVDFSIHKLQRMGARLPRDLKTELDDWVSYQWESGSQSLHFFVAFFEHWRSGQYTMALESLHRYFDYSVANVEKDGSDKLRSYYQYALLHLSVLHADFECWDDSIAAMNECIVSARENNDSTCLHFALSWLLYLRHAHPAKDGSAFGDMSQIVVSGSSEADELAILEAGARAGRHWVLLSSTLLEGAKLTAYSGGSIVKVQEQILQASYLNVQHDLKNMLSAAAAFQGAILERIGQNHLAKRTYEVPGMISPASCPLSDNVRLMCRLTKGLARAGSYSMAISMLRELTPSIRGVLKLQHRVSAFLTIIYARKALHSRDLDAASHHISQLHALITSNDPEIVQEIRLLQIELLMRQGCLEEALALVNKRLGESSNSATDFAHRLQVLLLKSSIFAAGGQPSQGFSITLRVVSTAHQHHLIPILLEGLANLSTILLDLSEFEAVRDIVTAILPHALESDQAHLVARLFVSIGEAHVGLAERCNPGSTAQAKHMRLAGDLIERGQESYNHIKDLDGMLDCLVMKSRLASWAGNDVSAQRADEMYMQLLNHMAV